MSSQAVVPIERGSAVMTCRAFDPAFHRRLVAGVAIALASTWAWASAASAQRYTIRGDRVAIYNMAGQVTIESGSGSEVGVTVTRGGRDAAKLSVSQGEVEGRQTVRVLYPGDRIVYPPMGSHSRTNLKVRNDGTFGGHGDSWMGRNVTVSGSGNGLEAHADLTITVPAGKDVIVRHAVGDVGVSNVDGKLLVDVCNSDVTARGTRGELSIDTGSGTVRVTDGGGDVSIDTGSGDVEVTNIKGDVLTIDTGSGEVQGTRLDAPHLSIDTGSGSVDLTDVKARVLAIDTGSGSVHVDLQSDIEALDVDTGSGDAVVMLPSSAGAMVSLESGNGDVNVAASMTRVRRDEGSLRGQLGDGHGTISIETGSGSIRLNSR
jgi:hypothetical protein